MEKPDLKFNAKNYNWEQIIYLVERQDNNLTLGYPNSGSKPHKIAFISGNLVLDFEDKGSIIFENQGNNLKLSWVYNKEIYSLIFQSRTNEVRLDLSPDKLIPTNAGENDNAVTLEQWATSLFYRGNATIEDKNYYSQAENLTKGEEPGQKEPSPANNPDEEPQQREITKLELPPSPVKSKEEDQCQVQPVQPPMEKCSSFSEVEDSILLGQPNSFADGSGQE